MGARLTILDEHRNEIFYGSKLYGYVSPIQNCESLKYLWAIKDEWGGNDYSDCEDFCWYMDVLPEHISIKLSLSQLDTYLEMYDADLCSFELDDYIQEDVEPALPEGINNVLLEWG